MKAGVSDDSQGEGRTDIGIRARDKIKKQRAEKKVGKISENRADFRILGVGKRKI